MGADETLPEKVPRQRELMLSCLTTIERKYSGTQSERWEEVPELEQWNGEFWRPNREFFSKNREFSAKIESSTSGTTRKSVGRSRRLRDARTSDTLQLAARSLDQAVSVVSPLLAGPVHSILRPSLRSVGRFPSAWGTPHSLAPRVELGLSTSSETSSL